VPQQGNLGISGATLLTPGDTASSLTSVRMHRLDEYRMPKVGSNLVDVSGVGVIDSWISSLTACP
jgi:hypothetical protein